MWTKTITVKYKGADYPVQVWFDGDYDKDASLSVVKVQSMMNEYILYEEIVFQERDNAYDFIKHYPVSMAKAFLEREAYTTGAIQG